MSNRLPRIHAACDLPVGASLQLPDDAARHVQVLRMQPGDSLCLFNGLGGSHTARVVHMGKHTVDVEVLSHEPQEREADCATHIALGMPANERMDWLVEKATELGVASITPLVAERSVLKLKGERAEKKLAHWQGVAVAAAEQCGRNRVPPIHPAVTLTEWLKKSSPGERWVLSLSGDTQPVPCQVSQEPVTVLSGPEGGLSRGEESAALTAGFAPVSLGPRVLRAETAPLAVLALCA